MPPPLADLTSEELLALVGLLKIVIEADKRFGLEESAALQLLAEEVGRSRFNQIVAQARERFPNYDAARAHAQTIERPAARELIHRTLSTVAYADRVHPAELSTLDWLARLWQLPGAKK